MDLKLYVQSENLVVIEKTHTHTHKKKVQKVVERWRAKIDLPMKYGSSEFLSAGSTFTEKEQ